MHGAHREEEAHYQADDDEDHEEEHADAGDARALLRPFAAAAQGSLPVAPDAGGPRLRALGRAFLYLHLSIYSLHPWQ